MAYGFDTDTVRRFSICSARSCGLLEHRFDGTPIAGAACAPRGYRQESVLLVELRSAACF
jgi:hypothetical protein